MAKQAPKRKGANGYKLPESLPKGEILTDISKKKWKLGISIGQGGFGEIYSAQEAESKRTSYGYVIKIEPHDNGPLFVEINFYIRNAKPQEVDEFKNKKKLKSFGMPAYLGSGSYEHKNQKYRFLVMHKFGTDIWKLFLENNRLFPLTTVFKLACQVLDVLEYIHEHGYVHGDIKGSNILLGLSKETKNQAYLVDFGLTTKYQTTEEYKPNPKKAHDGTIEYLSRDAHQGVPTRKGDLEILAYNLIQWLGCQLPWETDLSNPIFVQQSKERNMSNVSQFLKKCFGSKPIPGILLEFLKYINNLAFNSKPDYAKIRKMFISEIEKNGDQLNSPFTFNSGKQTSPSKRKVEPKVVKNKKMKRDESKNEEAEDNNKVKKQTKETKTVESSKITKTDLFDGYTPEMRAIAMKKLFNGVKKESKTKEQIDKSEAKIKTKNRLNSARPRRNMNTVNYNQNTF